MTRVTITGPPADRHGVPVGMTSRPHTLTVGSPHSGLQAGSCSTVWRGQTSTTPGPDPPLSQNSFVTHPTPGRLWNQLTHIHSSLVTARRELLWEGASLFEPRIWLLSAKQRHQEAASPVDIRKKGSDLSLSALFTGFYALYYHI